MKRFDEGRRITKAEALQKVPGSAEKRYEVVFEHGTLEVGIYAPVGVDHHSPHTRDEAYVIIAGTGTFVSDRGRQSFGPGDFLFAPAGVAHRFEQFSSDLAMWVLFYGPEGGERGARS